MPKSHISYKAKMISNSVDRAINRTVSEIGLTSSQVFILGYIHTNRDKRLCQKDIENNFNIKHPTATGILKRLEEKGLIECVPSSTDRRYKIITETDKAFALQMEVQNRIDMVESAALSGLTESEYKLLCILLDKVIEKVAPESMHPDFSIKEGESI